MTTLINFHRDILIEVLSFLKPSELEPVRGVCRRFYRLTRDPTLLSRIIEPNISKGRFTMRVLDRDLGASPVRCIHQIGNIVFTGHDDTSVRVSRVVRESITVFKQLPGPPFSSVTCLENNDTHLFSGYSTGDIRVWNLRSFE